MERLPTHERLQPRRLIAAAGRRLLGLFFPQSCPACGDTPRQGRFCEPCRHALPRPASPLCTICGLPFPGVGPDHACSICAAAPPPFEVLRGCYRYESDSPLAELIHRWKYGRDASLSGELTALFVAACPFTVDHDALIPVPLHVKRLRWRGFNQASVLAAALARHAGVEVLPHALRRIRATVPQVELAQPDRRRNVAGAFVAPQPAILNDRRLLLVDDVGTTGATVRECARVLRASGARSVDVVVLARASRPG